MQMILKTQHVNGEELSTNDIIPSPLGNMEGVGFPPFCKCFHLTTVVALNGYTWNVSRIFE